MTKDEAIKYLKQLYPNVGHCWLDEQRIDAIGMAIKALQEEPVSEDLEEISYYFACMCHPLKTAYSITSPNPDVIKAFKAGAKWQKAKDQSTIELAEGHAMLAGMEKMKEGMMAKAVDGYVIEDIEEGNGDFLLSAEYLPKSMGLKDQQKVKVIVIKK